MEFLIYGDTIVHQQDFLSRFENSEVHEDDQPLQIGEVHEVESGNANLLR